MHFLTAQTGPALHARQGLAGLCVCDVTILTRETRLPWQADVAGRAAQKLATQCALKTATAPHAARLLPL